MGKKWVISESSDQKTQTGQVGFLLRRPMAPNEKKRACSKFAVPGWAWHFQVNSEFPQSVPVLLFWEEASQGTHVNVYRMI